MIRSIYDRNDELMHYGVLGMKWGIRKYQNEDGSLTPAGRKHYKYTSFTTKHKYKKAAALAKKEKQAESEEAKQKYRNKRLAYEREAKVSEKLDAREQEYAERVKAGGNILSRILTMDAVGGKPYQQYLAMMNAQNEEGFTLKKLGAAVASNLVGRLGSTVVKQVYVSQEARKNE